MADERIKDLAHQILDNLASGLTAAGIDVPSKQYVTAGQIAFDFESGDCNEALIITWNGILQGAPNSQAGGAFVPGTSIKCAVPLVGSFSIALIRCVPTIEPDAEPPSADSLTTSGDQVMTDGMTMAAVVIDKHLAGELLEGTCTLVGMGDVTPAGPSGGLGGSVLTLYVSLV